MVNVFIIQRNNEIVTIAICYNYNNYVHQLLSNDKGFLAGIIYYSL